MAAAGRGRLRLGLLLVGIALLAFQLRSPLVAVAPVAGAAQEGWGIGPAAFGLLTTIPLLCFGLATPLGPLAARRFGVEGAIEVSIVGIVVSTVLRSLDGYGFALAAAVLLGVSITIGNVLVPTVIRRDVRASARAAATGFYAAFISVGTVLTSVATVPLAQLVGWRAAIAAWSVVGVLTAAFWLLLLRGRPADEPVLADQPPARFRPDLLAVLLSVAFASQAFSYYAVTTWLPTLLADERGFTAVVAGTASSVFQLAGVVGAIGVPVLALRLHPRTILAIIGVLWITLPLGLLLIPEQFVLLSVLGGTAQGAGFAGLFTIIATAGGDARRTTTLSAVVQSAGYLVAAAAPPLLGAVHEASGSWTAPMLVVLVTTASFLVFGVTAATVAARRPA
jgi:MFS transporter, CP family, cyanate transporter